MAVRHDRSISLPQETHRNRAITASVTVFASVLPQIQKTGIQKMNKLVEKHISETTRALAPRPGRDPFEAYADAIDPQNLVGLLLSFTKGIYVAGRDKTKIPEGSEFTAAVDQLLSGYVRWEDGKPAADPALVSVASGNPIPRRDKLGYDDERRWERDRKGNPRDPWQRTDYLPLLDAAGKQLYTLSITSEGGRRALAKLSREYAKHRRSDPDAYPVIALKAGSYQSPDYGLIDVPIFELIDWEPRDRFSKALVAAGYGPLPPVKPVEQLTESTVKQELDDEIPF